MGYSWADKEADCYRLFVREGKTLDEVIDWFRRERGFAPSKRAFQQQFAKWNFQSSRDLEGQDESLTRRIEELWEQNVGQRDMLRVLQSEGFDITERAMMRIRGRNRWLLRIDHVSQPSNGATADKKHTASVAGEARKQSVNPRRRAVVPEPDGAIVQAREGQLAKRQLESDQLWASRKRRRRTRTYAGLPPDPEGPPRFPSETTLDESKVVLELSNAQYRQLRDEFQAICEEEGVVKKTTAGSEKWRHVKDRLVRGNEHLTNVFNGDEAGKREQKLLSLDVVCQDVTKRIRNSRTRMTIADAKDVLSINSDEARTVRSSLYAILKAENFISKTDLGQARWKELKDAWVAESDLLKWNADQAEHKRAEREKAIEFIARDVMKRVRDDQAKLTPGNGYNGSGPGPAYASGKRKTKDKSAVSPMQGPAATATEVLAAQLLSASELQIDPSLLLAANGAMPISGAEDEGQGNELHAEPGDSLGDFPTKQRAPAVQHTSPFQTLPGSRPPEVGIWFRLHDHSPVQSDPRIWLASISAGTFTELRQKASEAHPETQAIRIDGVVKDGDGAEISYSIDDDMKLHAYLGHAIGGSATFVVQLASVDTTAGGNTSRQNH